MERTENLHTSPAFTQEERTHAIGALLLTLCAVAIAVASIALAFHKADPRGVYVCAYEISASGDRESGKSIEFHLKKDGVATYVSGISASDGQSVQLNGSWKRDGNKIILTFGGEQTVFYRSGKKLIEKLEDGGQIVYIKD